MSSEPTPMSNGQPVSEQTIERLAAQAEAGYDPARLRRVGGRPPMGSSAAPVVPVRLEPDLIAAVRQRAEADHTTASAVIREALRAWLAPA